MLAQSTWETRRGCTGDAASTHGADKGAQSQIVTVVSAVLSEPCAIHMGPPPDQHRTLAGQPPGTTLRLPGVLPTSAGIRNVSPGCRQWAEGGFRQRPARAWQTGFGLGGTGWFEDYLRAEGVASGLRFWSPIILPALFHTADYARAQKDGRPEPKD